MLKTQKTISNNLIPPEYQDWFPFDQYTKVQLESFPKALGTDENLLICAPTGSGKTAIANAAILRQIIQNQSGKVVYLAPMRALTYEKAKTWENRSGISSVVFTGEETPKTIEELNAYDLIISTPEKFDSASRKWRRPEYAFVSQVQLLILDEVHLLDTEGRGDALEALVSRLQRIAKLQESELRIIAMSATVPNYSEVAQWLRVEPENTLVFDDMDRPVPLTTKLESIPYQRNVGNVGKVKNRQVVSILNKCLKDDTAQALIFVRSRKETEKLASFLLDTWDGKYDEPAQFGYFATDDAQYFAKNLYTKRLQNCAAAGVAFHHAGLPRDDRNIVEQSFREGHIRVLISTTTLAWGVNLPARIVIIRDTSLYDAKEEGWKMLSSSDLKQMTGRAGRPGYDTKGDAYIIAFDYEVEDINYLLRTGKPLNSTFLDNLTEHLLAEIVDGAITNREEAIDWLTGTFHAILLQKRCQNVRRELKKQVDVDIDYLVKISLIEIVKGKIQSTKLGKITSHYYIRTGTADWFVQALQKIQQKEKEKELELGYAVTTIAEAMEFSNIVLRRNEENHVWAMQDIFPDFNRLTPPAQKVCYVLYCYLTGEYVARSMQAEAYTIRDNATRLFATFNEFCEDLLDYCPWTLQKAILSLRYRKPMATLLPNPEQPLEIKFEPMITELKVGSTQIVTTTIRNLLFHPINMTVSVVLNGQVITETEIDLQEKPWKFPFPLTGLEKDDIVLTVEVVPVGEGNPLQESVTEFLEIKVD